MLWSFHLAPDLVIPSPPLLWETSALPKWVSINHFALWAPLRSLRCLDGATGWDSETWDLPMSGLDG